MTVFEGLVLNEIRLGHTHAIPAHLIARRVGASDERIVRLAIRSLIEQRQPILASVKPPKGYFMAETMEEIKEYQEILWSRLKEDARRMRDIKLAGAKLLHPEQLRMGV